MAGSDQLKAQLEALAGTLKLLQDSLRGGLGAGMGNIDSSMSQMDRAFSFLTDRMMEFGNSFRDLAEKINGFRLQQPEAPAADPISVEVPEQQTRNRRNDARPEESAPSFAIVDRAISYLSDRIMDVGVELKSLGERVAGIGLEQPKRGEPDPTPPSVEAPKEGQPRPEPKGKADEPPPVPPRMTDLLSKAFTKISTDIGKIRFDRLGSVVDGLAKGVVTAGGRLAGAGVGAVAGAAENAALGGGVARGAMGGAGAGAAAGGAVAAGVLLSLEALSTAITGSIQAFTGLSKAVMGMVGAYNPAMLELFNMAMKDLMAVFGSGLQPILQAFTNVVRYAADALLPIIQKLAPVFEQLSVAVVSFFGPIVDAIAQVMNEAMPSFMELANIVSELATILGESFAEIIAEMYPVVIEFVTAIAALVKELMPPILSMVKLFYALEKPILMLLTLFVNLVTLITTLLRPITALVDFLSRGLFGLFGGGRQIQKPEKAQSTGMAARQAEYMDVEELSRNLIKAAFGSGSSVPQQQLNVQKRQLQVLERIAAKPAAIVQQPQQNQPGVR